MEYYKLDIKGYEHALPILPIGGGIKICFFNLHGAQALTEHCGKELAKEVQGAEEAKFIIQNAINNYNELFANK